MTRRGVFLVAAALALTAAACSDEGGGGRASDRQPATTITAPPPPTTTTSAPPGSAAGGLRVQVTGSDEDATYLKATVEAFEKANAGIDVELDVVQDSELHLARLGRSLAGSGEPPPDVFLVDQREHAGLLDQVAPIEPELRKERVDLGNAYHEPALAGFRSGNTLQCMPHEVSTVAVYYNTRLFSRAGIPRPAPDWTWDQFREIAIKLTAGDVKGVGIQPRIQRIAPFVWSNGGEIVDNPKAPTRITLGSPPARAALEFLRRLVVDDKTSFTKADLEGTGFDTKFREGKLGMLLTARKETAEFRQVAGLQWDVLPLPRAPGGRPATVVETSGWCLAKGSAKRQDGAKFVAFAVGAAGQEQAARSGRVVPVLKAAGTSAAFRDGAPEHDEVFVDAIATARTTPIHPMWSTAEDRARKTLNDLFAGEGGGLDAALADIEKRSARTLGAGAGKSSSAEDD